MEPSPTPSPATRRRRVRRLILVTVLLAVGAAASVPVLLRIAGYTGGLCLFRKVTGLLCPGCGTTRAASAVLHGHFLTAWRFNYLLPLELAWIARAYLLTARAYLRTGHPDYAPRSWIPDVVFLVILLAWAVVRNIVGI